MSQQIAWVLLFHYSRHLAFLCVNLIIIKYELKPQYVKLTQYDSKWVFSLIWQAYIIKFSKICFFCTYVGQMIIQQRLNVLLQVQFYNILTNVCTDDILKIYELHKIYNKKPKYCQALVLTIIIYQANPMSQLHQAFELHRY